MRASEAQAVPAPSAGSPGRNEPPAQGIGGRRLVSSEFCEGHPAGPSEPILTFFPEGPRPWPESHTQANAERREIEFLLPWYAAGTLSRSDVDHVERALAGDFELARRYALVLEELAETINVNETLGEPSARVAVPTSKSSSIITITDATTRA